MAPEICPNCGAEVPPKARACPECGADEQTGWSDVATEQRLDLPDASFDYHEFVRNEFGGETAQRRGPRWFWRWLAVALVTAFLAALIWRLCRAAF